MLSGAWGELPEQLFFTTAGAVMLWLAQRLFVPFRRRFHDWQRRRSDRVADEILDGTHFAFGGWEETIFVADLQLSGYSPADLETGLAGPLVVDDSIAEAVGRAAVTWKEKVRTGEAYNGEVIGVRQPAITRHGTHERPGLRLDFHTTDYVTQRSVADVYRSLPDDARRGIVREAASHPDTRFSVTFGVAIAIISADEKLIFVRRSNRSAVNSGAFTCGVAEGMAPTDVVDGRPDPFLTARRGLDEEFGIQLGPSDLPALKLTGLILNLDYWEWGMVGILDLRRAEEQRLRATTIGGYFRTARAKDKWEHGGVHPVDLTPEAVARFMAENPVTNYGVVAALAALLGDRSTSSEQVESAFARYAKMRKDLMALR